MRRPTAAAAASLLMLSVGAGATEPATQGAQLEAARVQIERERSALRAVAGRSAALRVELERLRAELGDSDARLEAAQRRIEELAGAAPR